MQRMMFDALTEKLKSALPILAVSLGRDGLIVFSRSLEHGLRIFREKLQDNPAMSVESALAIAIAAALNNEDAT
jgi:hypothetical protein